MHKPGPDDPFEHVCEVCFMVHVPEKCCPGCSCRAGELHRKIDLPDYCCPHTCSTAGGDEDCDHDYPPESKLEHDDWVEWTCSHCGMRTSFEVYQ